MVGTRFIVQCKETRPGQSVWIVGAPVELGSWQPQLGVKCTTSATTFPEWRSPELVLPPEFEFKLVIADENGGAFPWWEHNKNKYVKLLTEGTFPWWEHNKNKYVKLLTEGTVKCSWNCQDISLEVQKVALTGKDAEAPTATQSPSLMNRAWNLTQSGSVRGISGAEQPPEKALKKEGGGSMLMKREEKFKGIMEDCPSELDLALKKEGGGSMLMKREEKFKGIIEDCPSELDLVPGVCPEQPPEKALEKDGGPMGTTREEKSDTLKGVNEESVEDCQFQSELDWVFGMCPEQLQKALEKDGGPMGTTREEKSDTLKGVNEESVEDCQFQSELDWVPGACPEQPLEKALSLEDATLRLQKWWSRKRFLRELLKERMIQELMELRFFAACEIQAFWKKWIREKSGAR